MQIQKEDIRQIILETARNEFLEYGFKGVSMRTIANKAKVGLSNIYNYFRNKDEIYREVLAPLLNTIERMMEDHNEEENLTIEVFSSKEYHYKYVKMYMNLVENYGAELRLLLFHSHGSDLEGFRDECINRHTKTGMEYLKKMKEKYPGININISEFFIHTMSSSWFSLLGEIVTHNLSHAETEQFLSEYITYCTAGWEKMMLV